MALSTALSLVLNTNLTQGTAPLTASSKADISRAINLESGISAGKADKAFTAVRVVPTETTDTLDLAGALTDAFGSTITFAKLKLVYVEASTSNAGDIYFARPANGVGMLGGNSSVVLRPGGAFLWTCGAADAFGVPVTPGTGDLLDIINTGVGASATYTVVLVGTSA